MSVVTNILNPAQIKILIDIEFVVVEDYDGDTYRAVYTLKLRGAIYVPHAFQKKSTRGIATPRREIELIKSRYARAREHHAAHYGTQEER